MKRPLRVAVAQIDTTIGDFGGNATKILAAGRRAESEGADLVLFPELAVCGYPPRDLVERRAFLDETEKTAARIARASGRALWLFGSLARNRARTGRTVFNVAIAARRGRAVAVYHKRLLPTYDVFDEGRYFEPGTRPLVLTVAGARVGVTVCEDIWNDKTFWKRPLYPDRPGLGAAGAAPRSPRQHLGLPLRARQGAPAGALHGADRAALRRAARLLQPGRRQRQPRVRRRLDGARRARPRGRAREILPGGLLDDRPAGRPGPDRGGRAGRGADPPGARSGALRLRRQVRLPERGPRPVGRHRLRRDGGARRRGARRRTASSAWRCPGPIRRREA